MELGQKLLGARQEAGLSQRQLCGDVITRNMLSQIEHGTARPSMATLQYLAGRLGKPVSYFLEEELEISPNQGLMVHARRAYAEGKWEEVRAVLEGFQKPDAIFSMEYGFLLGKTTLAAASQAVAQQKRLYAGALLRDLKDVTAAFPELERQRIMLLASISETGISELCACLPSMDEELFVRARAAMEQKQWDRGLSLLAAMERDTPEGNLLAGRLLAAKGDYKAASESLVLAEKAYPKESAELLETCFRELGDFKQAYFYACKQRER